MTALLDLDGYFTRIRWGGAIRPNLETLTGLLDAHMSHIPFENLDVLLRRPVRLDLEHLQNKLVHARRGGYCFEHATLFGAVLDRLGFQQLRHAARVVLANPRTASPRTHMFLTVTLAEGTFVVDPGFGAHAPGFPVPVVEESDLPADKGTHRLLRDGGQWILQMQKGDATVDCWISTLEPENPVDFEMGNHYTATHASSPFVNRILMHARTADGRVSVVNRDMTVWQASQSRTRELADRAAVRAALVEYFGFDLPEVESLRVPSIPEWG